MDTVRGLTVWLGAPLLASLLCSAGWQLASGGHLAEWRPIVGLSLMALIFTIGGSTLLSLAFAAMEALAAITRYIALICLGAFAGGAIMIPFGTPGSVLAGIIYGVATASFWAGLHRAVYGSR